MPGEKITSGLPPGVRSWLFALGAIALIMFLYDVYKPLGIGLTVLALLGAIAYAK
jgi:hypothetical protein